MKVKQPTRPTYNLSSNLGVVLLLAFAILQYICRLPPSEAFTSFGSLQDINRFIHPSITEDYGNLAKRY